MRNDAALDVTSPSVFLATTALTEFWDTSLPVVFMGDWCKRGGHRNTLAELTGVRQLASPYDREGAVLQAMQTVTDIYERVLPVLAQRLEILHSVRYSARSWRLLLGPWLQLYVAAAYDRYLHIKQAQELLSGFTTIVMSKSSYVVPRDALEFACEIADDPCNLQMISKILQAMGMTFPAKVMPSSQNVLYGKLSASSWKYRFAGKLLRIYAKTGAIFRSTTLLHTTYFPRAVEIKLALKNFLKIFPVYEQSNDRTEIAINHDKRQSLRALEFGSDEFENCLATMLSSDLPQCFVENFDAIGCDAVRLYPSRVDAVFSANAWYFDEAFKRAAVNLSEQGAQLWGTQHGGNYGALVNMTSENHEMAITDRYFSWGWKRFDCVAEVIPMPASKLIDREVIGANNKAKGILWVATTTPRYLLQYPFIPKYFQDYLGWQRRFVEGLPENFKKLVRFRPHYEDYGWGISNRLLSCVSQLTIESWERSFAKSLIDCRLYVCDHLSTTFIEALSANKPTILFWDQSYNQLRPEAIPYYNLLRREGILFDTPEAAIEAIDNVYDDVESWWNSHTRQQAVEDFCNQFARTSPDAFSIWGRELTTLTRQRSC
jgi:putative transferase (TIGR04331 family)